MMKLIISLTFLAFSSNTFASPLCDALNGEWLGEGSNVYYGNYFSKWVGTCDEKKDYEFLSGELKITSKNDPNFVVRFPISATKYRHAHSSPTVIKITEINPKPMMVLPGVGEEETLIASQIKKIEWLAWRQVDASDKSKIARGLRIQLSEEGVLAFGLMFSQVFCEQNGEFSPCVSDRYSPFLLQKKL